MQPHAKCMNGARFFHTRLIQKVSYELKNKRNEKKSTKNIFFFKKGASGTEKSLSLITIKNLKQNLNFKCNTEIAGKKSAFYTAYFCWVNPCARKGERGKNSANAIDKTN